MDECDEAIEQAEAQRRVQQHREAQVPPAEALSAVAEAPTPETVTVSAPMPMPEALTDLSALSGSSLRDFEASGAVAECIVRRLQCVMAAGDQGGQMLDCLQAIQQAAAISPRAQLALRLQLAPQAVVQAAQGAERGRAGSATRVLAARCIATLCNGDPDAAVEVGEAGGHSWLLRRVEAVSYTHLTLPTKRIV
eukprot:TRINITY_DN31098_c0_g1_i3.p2 TRINITY_DN31098_c0_g1~~TRINITY_DN31098_c0_g1_i3.p2  ORF type:complete len:194 (-),score=35.84 TRINITY_DN31098_c0_g1_i3:119-700(-)